MSPRGPGSRAGTAGWVALGAGVVAWDVLAPETLSDAFGRGCATRPGKAVTIMGWAVLTAHLFDVLPKRVDPLYRLCTARNHARSAR